MFAYGWMEEGVGFVVCQLLLLYNHNISLKKVCRVLEIICLSKKYFFFYQTLIELRFLIEFEQYQYGWEGDKTCS